MHNIRHFAKKKSQTTWSKENLETFQEDAHISMNCLLKLSIFLEDFGDF